MRSRQGGAHDTHTNQAGRKERREAAPWILGASHSHSQGTAGDRRGARRDLAAGCPCRELTRAHYLCTRDTSHDSNADSVEARQSNRHCRIRVGSRGFHRSRLVRRRDSPRVRDDRHLGDSPCHRHSYAWIPTRRPRSVSRMALRPEHRPRQCVTGPRPDMRGIRVKRHASRQGQSHAASFRRTPATLGLNRHDSAAADSQLLTIPRSFRASSPARGIRRAWK